MRNWDVLLLGGNSASGKSTAAREIERREPVSWFDADAMFIGLLAATTPEQFPDVHLFSNTDAMRVAPTGTLFPRFLAACEIVSRAISITARHHMTSDHPAVIEATWITPSMADFALRLHGPRLRSVFVCDTSSGHITRGMRFRWAMQPDRHPPYGARQLLVDVARDHGRWLRAECARVGIPVVNARPRDTLVDRILAAADGGARPVPRAIVDG